MMNERERLELIERISSGVANDEELRKYNTWCNTLQEQGLPVSDFAVQKSSMLLNINHKIDQVKVIRLRYYRIASLAAAIAVIVFGSWFFFASRNGLNTEFGPRSQFANDVLPGKNTATLTLPNGKKIALSDVKNGIVIDATKIAYNDGTSLRGMTKQSLLLDEPASSSPVLITTPRGGQYQVVLPDGTHVWLNAASTLKFPAVFANNERRVELIGEGFFEVQHNEKKPFRVMSKGQMVEDLGTEFNISAYTDETSVKTTLVSGAAKVNGLTLKPNEQSVLTDKSIKIVAADVEKDLAWKNGDFIFRDDDFRTVMRKISRWYDVEVFYDEDAPNDLKLAGWMPRSKNISSILNTMQSTGKVHFKVNGRRIIVEK